MKRDKIHCAQWKITFHIMFYVADAAEFEKINFSSKKKNAYHLIDMRYKKIIVRHYVNYKSG